MNEDTVPERIWIQKSGLSFFRTQHNGTYYRDPDAGSIEYVRVHAPTGSEIDLTWGENRIREPGKVHIEWHAPCGCAFHPTPFPHVHPCSDEHKRPDLHVVNHKESEKENAAI
jgi:hypothetical protein